ncbi:unnamed protein product [Spirodela intermedia]|uniref:Uncharacterized protein n=1 Tax=Spirodela intermedia TaxID=51605 RepID=A0ABN7E9Z1_SPIIN|nr:unnamed protein product [Spirodela intermedia]
MFPACVECGTTRNPAGAGW